MIALLRKLLSEEEEVLALTSVDEQKVATAALLVEAALSDETYCDDERAKVAELLKRHYNLEDKEVNTLITETEKVHGASNQILKFTRTVKEAVEYEERVHIIEMLWDLAYADGEVSVYESNLIRRICGLIYVDDVESGKARKRVLARLGISG